MTSKTPSELFSLHEHALERELETCPECGAKLQIRSSKSGPFLSCSAYPKCQYSRPLVQASAMESQVIDGSRCPQCEKPLAVKSGRYGMFIGCTGFPECDYHENPNQAQESDKAPCPVCSKGELESRTSRFGKVFWGCNRYPKCKYVVNYTPVAEACPKCGWSILVERNLAAGPSLACPQKACNYKRSKD